MKNLWSCGRGDLENVLFTEDVMNKRQILYIAENVIMYWQILNSFQYLRLIYNLFIKLSIFED